MLPVTEASETGKYRLNERKPLKYLSVFSPISFLSYNIALLSVYSKFLG